MDAPDLFAEEDDSPGWTAIETRLGALYPGQEPIHFGPIIDYVQGGPDPLEATSAFRCDDARPHWHFVSFGFSELHGKVSEDPHVSGFGFELTLRVARDADERHPPHWPVDLLQSLARYVFTTGNAFDEGHHMDLAGPLAIGLESTLQAVALRRDPALPPLQTPNGQVKFLQLVGLTEDELTAVRDWDPERFLELLEREHPLLFIEPQRASLLSRPELKAQVEALTLAEGSSQEAAYVLQLGWTHDSEGLRLELDASSAHNLTRLLQGRTLHGKDFTLVCGDDVALEVIPGTRLDVTTEGHACRLTLTPELARQVLAELGSNPGRWRWGVGPDLSIELLA